LSDNIIVALRWVGEADDPLSSVRSSCHYSKRL